MLDRLAGMFKTFRSWKTSVFVIRALHSGALAWIEGRAIPDIEDIDGFVIRRGRDRSLININQDNELAVDTSVIQVRNCIGANRFAVVIEDCDEIRLVFVQEGSVVQEDDVRRCSEIVTGYCRKSFFGLDIPVEVFSCCGGICEICHEQG